MNNQFWNAPTYSKSVLIVPNYTYFGDGKDINKDSFVLVLKSFIDNSTDMGDVMFLLPHPDSDIPSVFARYDNVKLIPMGELSSFPPLMRVQFPSKFFKKVLNEYPINMIWSHLPEWTNQLLITRRYTPFQPIIGYCHWWELKDNGGYHYNSFVDNINGILQMEVCGVNSIWVKNLVIKRAGEIFNSEVCKKLQNIIQPWYLGMDDSEIEIKPKETIPTFLFNHRINEYTGGDWFFTFMDKLWEDGYQFKVFVTSADIDKEYVVKVGSMDRDTYLQNISSATFGIGAFKKYSAWSMSVTDGLSVGVPYLLPTGLCYEEMVGKEYPYLYSDRKELERWITQILKGEFTEKKVNFDGISFQNNWYDRIGQWEVRKYLDNPK